MRGLIFLDKNRIGLATTDLPARSVDTIPMSTTKAKKVASLRRKFSHMCDKLHLPYDELDVEPNVDYPDDSGSFTPEFHLIRRFDGHVERWAEHQLSLMATQATVRYWKAKTSELHTRLGENCRQYPDAVCFLLFLMVNDMTKKQLQTVRDHVWKDVVWKRGEAASPDDYLTLARWYERSSLCDRPKRITDLAESSKSARDFFLKLDEEMCVDVMGRYLGLGTWLNERETSMDEEEIYDVEDTVPVDLANPGGGETQRCMRGANCSKPVGHPGFCNQRLGQTPKKMETREAIGIMSGNGTVDDETKFAAVRQLVGYDRWKQSRTGPVSPPPKKARTDASGLQGGEPAGLPGEPRTEKTEKAISLSDVSFLDDGVSDSLDGQVAEESQQTGELILGDRYQWTLSATLRTEDGIKLSYFVDNLMKCLNASRLSQDAVQMQIEARSADSEQVIGNISRKNLREYATRRRQFDALSKKPVSSFRS